MVKKKPMRRPRATSAQPAASAIRGTDSPRTTAKSRGSVAKKKPSRGSTRQRPANLVFHDGLIPAIVRHATTGMVLTLAWMNEESLSKTVETGETWFWSRSRQELWHKGATSGNRQRVIAINADCDRDALVVSVEPSGPACHTGAPSCFEGVPSLPLDQLMKVLQDRFVTRPEGSYSARLFEGGRDRILKKVGEEATEVVIASLGQGRERMVSEIADLIFHLSVLLVDEGLEWADVTRELGARAK